MLEDPTATKKSIVREISEKARTLGADLKFPLSRCASSPLTQYDVLVLQRGPLLESASELLPILAAVEAGTFEKMALVSADEIRAAERAEALKVAELEDEVLQQTATGFGIIVLDNSSEVLCEIVADGLPAHAPALEKYADRLVDELGATPISVAKTADETFVSAKRGQCGALYASSEDLGLVVKALILV